MAMGLFTIGDCRTRFSLAEPARIGDRACWTFAFSRMRTYDPEHGSLEPIDFCNKVPQTTG